MKNKNRKMTRSTSVNHLNIRLSSKRCFTGAANVANITTLCLLGFNLSACQTTAMSQTAQQQAAIEQIEQPAQFAKSMLNSGLRQQVRNAHAFNTNIIVSNQNHRDALSQATPQQLSMADDKKEHCERIHDNAYIDLIQLAKSQGGAVTDDAYGVQRKTIEQAMINCDLNRQIWHAAHTYAYGDDDENSDYGHDYDRSGEISELDTSERRDAYAAQDYLPNYDDAHTQRDVKKVNLINAYLLKPTRIGIQGVYKPFSGMMTIVPSLQYRSRNHISAMNQPIYVDAKNGNVYIWADNFGYLVSSLADDNLGGSWHNKWLKLELEDGSLPKGFGKDLIKAHFTALNSANVGLSPNHFQLLDMQALNNLTPALADAHISAMASSTNPTSYIVSRQFDKHNFESYSVDYHRAFYELLSAKYPELIDSESTTINNKFVVTHLLSFMKQQIDQFDRKNNEADDFEQNTEVASIQLDTEFGEVGFDEDSTAESGGLNQSTLVEYAKLSDSAQNGELDNSLEHTLSGNTDVSAFTEYYGIDSQKKISWRLQRFQLPDKDDLGRETGEGVAVDSFTQYTAVPLQSNYYPNLPKEVQVPNAQNSIDIKQYGKSLMETYEQGRGAQLGRVLFSMTSVLRHSMGSLAGSVYPQNSPYSTDEDMASNQEAFDSKE